MGLAKLRKTPIVASWLDFDGLWGYALWPLNAFEGGLWAHALWPGSVFKDTYCSV